MEESAEGLVEALLYEKVKDIAKWLSSENQRPLTLTLNMREYVGKGIDTSFKEKTTDVLTVVLQKDRDVLNDFGFHVKTAYPNIKHEDARYTGKSFQKEALEILKTEESSLCKGFWGLAMSGFEPFVSNKNAETKVIVPLTPDKIEYLLVFSEYNIPTVYHNSPNNTSRPFRDISNPDLPLEISTEANRAINAFNKFVRELKPDISIEFESFRTDNAVFCENTER